MKLSKLQLCLIKSMFEDEKWAGTVLNFSKMLV